MRIKIAGGCGEHGRNCFYIEGKIYTFLVDCGLMPGEADGGYPRLTENEIMKIDYIILTITLPVFYWIPVTILTI